MDHDTRELLALFNQQTPETTSDTPVDMATIRAGARAMFLNYAGESPPQGDVISINASTNDSQIPARVYYPHGREEKDKVLSSVIFFHGGGWSLGDLDCYQDLMHALSNLSGAIFISIDYRLAPENKFPAGLDDAYNSANWLFKNITTLGGEPSNVAMMGDSAGANLALVVANKLHRHTTWRLSALHLIYPVLDVASPHQTYQSRLDFGDGNYLLARDAIDGTCQWYLTPDQQSSDPAVSPMFLSQLELLPPTSVLVAGYDPLRDEGMVFSEKLKKAGTLARFKCFDSTIHAFVSFGILPVSQDARHYLAQALKEDFDNA